MKLARYFRISIVTVAVAWAGAARAAANGDIFEILPAKSVNNQWVFSLPTEPLDIGDTAYFMVRLMKPSPGSNQFRLVHQGSASEAVDWATNRPSIGIYVNGVFTIARLEDYYLRGDNIFTDFIFSYTVKPGDFAQPIRLALADGSMVVDADDEPLGSYYLDFLDMSLPNEPAWRVDDSTDNEPATRDANFYYGSMRYSAASPDASGTGQQRTKDYDLSKCNFRIRTVDFDAVPESADYWRSVYQHKSLAMPAGKTPSLVVSDMPTNSTTLYVWSENPEAVVLIDGGDVESVSTRRVYTNATSWAERQVGVVKIVAGKQEYRMNLRGVLATNDATIVLSAFPGYHYNSMNERLRDEYQTRVVRCIGQPPSVSNVVARQRWPWNGLVDVDYDIGGHTEGLKVEIEFDEQGGRHWAATNFLAGAAPKLNPGRNRATWDTTADGATNITAEVKATVKLLKE